MSEKQRRILKDAVIAQKEVEEKRKILKDKRDDPKFGQSLNDEAKKRKDIANKRENRLIELFYQKSTLVENRFEEYNKRKPKISELNAKETLKSTDVVDLFGINNLLKDANEFTDSYLAVWSIQQDKKTRAKNEIWTVDQMAQFENEKDETLEKRRTKANKKILMANKLITKIIKPEISKLQDRLIEKQKELQENFSIGKDVEEQIQQTLKKISSALKKQN